MALAQTYRRQAEQIIHLLFPHYDWLASDRLVEQLEPVLYDIIEHALRAKDEEEPTDAD